MKRGEVKTRTTTADENGYKQETARKSTEYEADKAHKKLEKKRKRAQTNNAGRNGIRKKSIRKRRKRRMYRQRRSNTRRG